MLTFQDIPSILYGLLKIKMGYKYPLKVTQYLTYRCNFSCGFCGRRLGKSKELTLEESKRCITEFKKLGTKYWGFNGGEPLLYKDIGELINFAKKIGLKCSISTNGWYLPEKIDEIKNIDLVILSLDGDKQTHDANRSVGSYQRVIDSLELLKQRGIKVIINFLLNKNSIHCVDHILYLANKYDYECFIQPILIHKEDKEKKALRYFLPNDKMKKIIDDLILKKKLGERISTSTMALKQIASDKFYLPDCWAGKIVFTVSPDGRILPCADLLSKSSSYKSFLDVGVKGAIESIPDMSKCRICDYYSCYNEYNLALKSLFGTGIKIIRNKLRNRWLWE